MECVAARGFAFDLQYRPFCVDTSHARSGSAWPAPWRARIRPSHCTRQDYRLTAYGDTADAAVAALYGKVDAVDRAVNLVARAKNDWSRR